MTTANWPGFTAAEALESALRVSAMLRQIDHNWRIELGLADRNPMPHLHLFRRTKERL